MITNTTTAPIAFKHAFYPKNGWINYGVVLALLLVIALVLAKKFKSSPPDLSGLNVIEKKTIGNKTTVYVLEYQQQRVLLADNQHALTLHGLRENGDTRESR